MRQTFDNTNSFVVLKGEVALSKGVRHKIPARRHLIVGTSRKGVIIIMIKRPTEIATRRDESLMLQDMLHHQGELAKQLRNARVCVIGGAGSIGQATLEKLATFDIRDLVILDHNENGLASLTRQFQSAAEKPKARSITTLPLDFGSDIAGQFFESHPAFDFVLNFAALKHVRSEKDAFSSLALIETNVLKPVRLLSWLAERNPRTTYFSVSTDKAANPVSIMGATKRLMEHAIFGSRVSLRLTGRKVSARFANVAYSNGSLLESFALRLEAGVPLAAPVGIMRYFLTREEAGELCLLTSLLGDTQTLYIPRLSADENLVAVEDVARQFLEANGYEADVFTLDEEDDAKSALTDLAREKRWPLILTPADTAGEKPFEEFVGQDESAMLSPFRALNAIRYGTHLTSSEIDASLDQFSAMVGGQTAAELSLDLIRSEIAELEPAFAKAHKMTGVRLDDRI